MNTRQYHKMGALEGVQEYCIAHPLEAPPPGYTAQVAALGEVLDRLHGHVIVQGADGEGERGESRRQRALADRIRHDEMIPIRRIAFAWLKDVPELETKFLVPRVVGGHRPLAVALRVMAQSAEPYTELFVRHGAPPDLIAKLLASAEEVESAIAGRRAKAGARAAATQGIHQELSRGFEVVRQIEAVLKSRFGRDKTAHAEYRALRRVTRTGARRVGGAVAVEVGPVLQITAPEASVRLVQAPAEVLSAA